MRSLFASFSFSSGEKTRDLFTCAQNVNAVSSELARRPSCEGIFSALILFNSLLVLRSAPSGNFNFLIIFLNDLSLVDLNGSSSLLAVESSSASSPVLSDDVDFDSPSPSLGNFAICAFRNCEIGSTASLDRMRPPSNFSHNAFSCL